MNQRIDFIFSYWIFAWYVLYESGLVSYNPKGALALALVENLILLSLLFYYAYPDILMFCVINFFIKVVPLWRVMRTPYYMSDVYATVVLFGVYCVWLFMNRVTIMNILKSQLDNVKDKKPIGPGMTLLQKYRSRIKQFSV